MRQRDSAPWATIVVIAAAPIVQCGCVRSVASTFEAHLVAIVPPSARPTPEVAIAFGLDQGQTNSVVAIAGK